MKKTHDGHKWVIEKISDDSFSVLCLDPTLADDNTDYTNWPDDSVISQWIGERVTFEDSGDHPDYPEAIFVIEDRDLYCRNCGYHVMFSETTDEERETHDFVEHKGFNPEIPDYDDAAACGDWSYARNENIIVRIDFARASTGVYWRFVNEDEWHTTPYQSADLNHLNADGVLGEVQEWLDGL